MEDKCVTRNDFLPELHIVYLHEISRISFRIFNGAKYKHASSLSHCLHKKHPWHHRLLREMTLEERLVHSHILDSYNILLSLLDNLVNQQERIAMRKQLSDTVYIHQRRLRRIIYRCLNFLTHNFLADLLSKSCIYRMSRTSRYDTAL
jgi:hypothetical protein